MSQSTSQHRPLFTIPTSRVGKLGCGIALILWFSFLLLPCAMFSLATAGEITLSQQGVPEPASQPLMQIKLIMEPDERGLQFTRSFVAVSDDAQLCVQTNVNYVLWQTETEGDQSVVYCDCYASSEENAAWTFTETTLANCAP